MEGQMVEYTKQVAEELALRCRADPMLELAAWIRIAEQRESMVVELYQGGAIARRLPGGAADGETGRIAAKAIGAVWAQETSHKRLLASLRIVAEERGVRLEGLLGTIEGIVTDRATSRGPLGAIARFVVGLGRTLRLAPELTKQLDAMRFTEFCRFSSELEQTAMHGYGRILALLDLLDGTPHELSFGLLPRYEITKTLAEERFHGALFDHLVTWLASDGERFLPRRAADCIVELRDLAEAFLAVPAVQELPAPIRQRFAGRGADLAGGVPWVSDGGLGELFSEIGCTVTELKSDTVVAAADARL